MVKITVLPIHRRRKPTLTQSALIDGRRGLLLRLLSLRLLALRLLFLLALRLLFLLDLLLLVPLLLALRELLKLGNPPEGKFAGRLE